MTLSWAFNLDCIYGLSSWLKSPSNPAIGRAYHSNSDLSALFAPVKPKFGNLNHSASRPASVLRSLATNLQDLIRHVEVLRMTVTPA
jgi:hypothetical protein